MTRTLDNPTDDSYFEWLVWKAQGGDSDDPSETYWCLFSLMHKTEFTWFVPNDGNRAGDGEDLRNEYSSYSTYGWANYGPCTMLELLIGLAKRMDDMIGIEPLSSISQPHTAVPFYISELLNNLGLRGMADSEWDDEMAGAAQHILERVCDRTYGYYGEGGLFPVVKDYGKDMSKEELWYQLCSYVNEHMHY